MPIFGPFYRRFITSCVPVTSRERFWRSAHHPYTAFEDSYRVIFVHVPKTGGRAIIRSLFGVFPCGHDPLVKYFHADSQKYFSYYKCAIVRNPWDRLVSAYFYLMNGGISANDIEFRDAYLKRYRNFRAFVFGLAGNEYGMQKWTHFRPQSYYICNREGRIAVDYLGRYEELECAFHVIGDALAIQHSELLSFNVGKHASYETYYDDEMIKCVSDVYRSDIELLGYSFV